MIQLDGWIEYDTVAFAGPILESKGVRATFQEKSKKGQNIWKFGQKYTKFVDILKKGNLHRDNETDKNQKSEGGQKIFIFRGVTLWGG